MPQDCFVSGKSTVGKELQLNNKYKMVIESLLNIMNLANTNVSVSSLLNSIEKIVFNRMNKSHTIQDLKKTAAILSSIHRDVKSHQTVKGYIQSLTQYENIPFLGQLDELVSAVADSENPVAVLQAIVDANVSDNFTPSDLQESLFFDIDSNVCIILLFNVLPRQINLRITPAIHI